MREEENKGVMEEGGSKRVSKRGRKEARKGEETSE